MVWLSFPERTTSSSSSGPRIRPAGLTCLFPPGNTTGSAAMHSRLFISPINSNLHVSFLSLKQVSYLLPRIPTFIIQITKQTKQNTENNGLYYIFKERMNLPEDKIPQQIHDSVSYRRNNCSDKVVLHFKSRSSKWRGVSPLPSLGTVLDSLPSHGSSYLLLLSC